MLVAMKIVLLWITFVTMGLQPSGTISSNLAQGLVADVRSSYYSSIWYTCSTISGAVDSGWYTAKVYMPLSTTERDQTINLRATDLSRAEQPQGQVTVVATRGLPSEARQLTVMPMSQEVGINQDIPTIIFVQDSRGFGLSCTSSGAVANSKC
jgi:hypothetical protein